MALGGFVSESREGEVRSEEGQIGLFVCKPHVTSVSLLQFACNNGPSMFS